MPRPDVRQAGTRAAAAMLWERGMRALGDIHTATGEALNSLEREGAFGAGVELRVMSYLKEALGPDLSPAADATAAQTVRMVRDLLYVCVHPTLPVDRQLSMLLRFAFWLPNDAAATVLQVHPSTIGIHLRQSCRRLGAVARRGGRGWTAGRESHALTVLKLLDRLRRRGLEMRTSSPRIAEAVLTDAPVYASLLLESESGPAKAEAHAFLAELHLGDERARRRDALDDPGLALPIGITADPAGDAVPRGLRHLRIAQELGARGHFYWLARIHASYLLPSDPADIDWQQLVGLYEGLLRASAPESFDPTMA